LNESFRKEFKQVLPCFYSSQANKVQSRRFLSERTCNGNETVQESYLPSTSGQQQTGHAGLGKNPPTVTALEPIEELLTDSQTVVALNYDEVSANFCSSTNEVQIHVPESHEMSEQE